MPNIADAEVIKKLANDMDIPKVFNKAVFFNLLSEVQIDPKNILRVSSAINTALLFQLPKSNNQEQQQKSSYSNQDNVEENQHQQQPFSYN